MELNSESEVEDAVSEVPIKAKAKAPRSPVKFVNQSKKSKPSSKVEGHRVKKEPRVVEQTVTLRAPSSSPPVSRSKMVEVPSFMDATWASTFLLMLYDIFGRSQHPFRHFSKSNEAVKNIQDTIDLMWPGTDYQIQWSDAACSDEINKDDNSTMPTTMLTTMILPLRMTTIPYLHCM